MEALPKIHCRGIIEKDVGFSKTVLYPHNYIQVTHIEYYLSRAMKMGHVGFAIFKTVLASFIAFSPYIAV